MVKHPKHPPRYGPAPSPSSSRAKFLYHSIPHHSLITYHKNFYDRASSAERTPLTIPSSPWRLKDFKFRLKVNIRSTSPDEQKKQKINFIGLSSFGLLYDYDCDRPYRSHFLSWIQNTVNGPLYLFLYSLFMSIWYLSVVYKQI